MPRRGSNFNAGTLSGSLARRAGALQVTANGRAGAAASARRARDNASESTRTATRRTTARNTPDAGRGTSGSIRRQIISGRAAPA